MAGATSVATRVLLVVGLIAMPLVALNPAPVSAAPVGVEYAPPVDGPVVAPYREPVGPYGAGHRGIDFAAAPGSPVRAAADGVVTFAGEVAGSWHVVVAHDDGIRTSYSYLSRVDVAAGAPVHRGAVVGLAGGSGGGHEPGVLHFGARVSDRTGDRYFDPMVLFAQRDLTQMVRLVPSGEQRAPASATPQEEAAALLRGLLADGAADDGCGGGTPIIGDAISAVCDIAGDALDAGLGAVRAAGTAGEELARRLAKPMHDLLDAIRPLTDAARKVLLAATPAGRVLSDLLDMGERILDQLTRECDPAAPPANGSGGSGNVAVAVGGIDSHRDQAVDDQGRPTSSFGFQPAKLGYQPGDVHYFSYRDHSTTYGSPDTHRPILESAQLLAEQLRAWATAHPGRKFDLVGHSQGGVVILAFLAFFYQGHEGQYPPIDNVVTFASPLGGAPLATMIAEIRRALLGRVITDLFAGANPYPPPELNSPSVLDLAETSRLMKQLDNFSVPASIHWTSITGSMDFVVPAQQGHVDGATEVTVTVGNAWSPLDDHSGILRDDDALAAARAGLEHRSPPCTSIGTALVGAVAPVVFARVAHTAGDLGWLATSAVP